MKIRLIGAAAAGCITLVLSIPAHAQSGCIKEVFYKYCLGSSVQPLLSQHVPMRSSEKSGTTHYVFSDGADQTNVAVVKGRIQTVSRRYAGTQQTFNQMSSELRGIYGEPKRTTGSGSSAGRITELWDQSRWRVFLVWDRNKNVQLIYRHEALAEARRDAKAAAEYGSNPKGY